MLQIGQTSVINPLTYAPFDYHQASQEECYVLDLSKKRVSSPDYTYCYPSPKSSPNHGECEPLKYSPQTPKFQERLEQETRILSQSYPDFATKTPQEDKAKREGVICYTQACPKSPSCCSDTTSEASYMSGLDTTGSPKTNSKMPRPFKTLPKDSLSLAFSVISQINPSSLIIDDNDADPEITKKLIEDSMTRYSEFRDKMLQKLQNSNNSTNKNMRRMQVNTYRSQDPDYLEKRRKNNSAAKRSRDARRNKQDEIAIRVAFLEQENIMLKYKIQSEKEDLERLQRLVTVEK